MSRDARYDSNIFHDFDHDACRRKLDALYGRVVESQNRAIIRRVRGPRVLDVGAGYGTLTRDLARAGYSATGIEPNAEKIDRAREWYGLDLLPRDIYETGFEDRAFDTVILREVVFHLDFPKALEEIQRICGRQVIVFQGNDVLLRKLGQTVHGHKEFNEQPRRYYTECLEKAGYRIEETTYRDLLAFPLSGGWIGSQLLPPIPVLYGPAVTADEACSALLNATGLARWFCVRFLVNAIRDAS